jgi:hypothetical protein
MLRYTRTTGRASVLLLPLSIIADAELAPQAAPTRNRVDARFIGFVECAVGGSPGK